MKDRFGRWVFWPLVLAFALFFPYTGQGNQNNNSLTPGEKDWLDRHRTEIVIGNEQGWPPITFHDKTGQPIGIAVDYVRLIEEKLGIRFRFDKPDTWGNIIRKLYDKEIDVMYDVQKNPERSRHVLFTGHYIEIPTVVIVRKEITADLDLEKMRGMTVAVAEKSDIYEFLSQYYTGLEIHPEKDPKTCLVEVSTKAVDAAVVSLAAASFIIERQGITNLRVAGYTPHKYQLSFAVRNDWPVLAAILDKGLARITRAEKDEIFRKWISLEIVPLYKRKNFWIVVSGVVGTAAFFILMVLAVNRKLKAIVERRTASLEKQTRVLRDEVAVRRQAEDSLRMSETRMRTLIETIPDLVWVKDINGVYVSCNLKFEQLFGVKEDEIIGRTDYDFVDRKLGDFFRVSDDAALESGEPVVYEREVDFAADGHSEFLETVKTPMYDAEGNLIGILGVARDITRRKKMEERVMQAQKMEALGTLAGGIAHDFNNILSTIMGFTELARLSTRGDEETQKNLKQVLESGVRARELIKHILTFSRKAEVQKDIIRIAPLIKESIRFVKAFIPPNMEIRMDIRDSDSLVLADPTQMHQVVMNLFTNAIHAMKETGGVLDIRFRAVLLSGDDPSCPKDLATGPYVELIVSDTGCGIPANLVNKIFEPFFTTKPRGEGTGMGLSTAYGIINEMKGHISVSSRPGEGALFQILLPRQNGGETAYTELEPDDTQKGRGNILLVDDEETIMAWSSSILRKIGFTVDCAYNGAEALETFKKGSYDLVLTDLAMPEMTGLELASLIHAESPEVPVVLVTGFSEGLTKESVKDYGICEIVLKPMIASELVAVINTHIKI